MAGYTKLFGQILNSSIWDEDDQTRLVWITLLAMTDKDGMVLSTVSSLARNSRVSKEACLKALEKFLAPDPNSMTKDNEGRRIAVVDGGWHLLNHAKYRELMGLEERREYYRRKKAEYRHRAAELRAGQTGRELAKERSRVKDELE